MADATPVSQGCETVAFSVVYTSLAISRNLVTGVTVAAKTSLQVHAAAILADIRVLSTFVNILALVPVANLTVPFWTDAHERSDQVLAGITAFVLRRGTLI